LKREIERITSCGEDVRRGRKISHVTSSIRASTACRACTSDRAAARAACLSVFLASLSASNDDSTDWCMRFEGCGDTGMRLTSSW
jgi:hypothetical protein